MNLDRELQVALDVEPSPEFVARVRQRIANEPAPQRWRGWWVMTAAAVASVVVAGVIVATRASHAPPSGERLLPSRTLAMASAAVPEGSPKGLPYGVVGLSHSVVGLSHGVVGLSHDVVGLSHGVVGRPFRAAGAGVGRPFRAADEADILIDPRERATLLRLIANVGGGRVDLKAVLAPGPFSVAEPASTNEIQIPAILIAPLDPGGEGARQ